MIELAPATRAAVTTAEEKLARLDRVAERRSSERAAHESLTDGAARAGSALAWARGEPLSAPLVSALHAAVVGGERRKAGRLRNEDVFVGCQHGPVQCSRFVPVPHGEQLRAGFEEWIEWLNRTDSHFSPVEQAGLAHYQLLTLHPFSDGNGRLGRLAIVLQLVRRGALSHPTLALTPWLEAHKAEYQHALLGLSRTGDWDLWLRFFARMVGAAADDTRTQLANVAGEPACATGPRRETRVGDHQAGRRIRGDRRAAGLIAASVTAFGLAACGGGSPAKSAAGVTGPSEVAASPISTPGRNPCYAPPGNGQSRRQAAGERRRQTPQRSRARQSGRTATITSPPSPTVTSSTTARCRPSRPAHTLMLRTSRSPP